LSAKDGLAIYITVPGPKVSPLFGTGEEGFSASGLPAEEMKPARPAR